MKSVYKELALQAGGSHYPEVGGDLLEKFADLLVSECVKAIEQTPRHAAFTAFDVGVVEKTIELSVKQVKDKFEL